MVRVVKARVFVVEVVKRVCVVNSFHIVRCNKCMIKAGHITAAISLIAFIPVCLLVTNFFGKSLLKFTIAHTLSLSLCDKYQFAFSLPFSLVAPHGG